MNERSGEKGGRDERSGEKQGREWSGGSGEKQGWECTDLDECDLGIHECQHKVGVRHRQYGAQAMVVRQKS